MPAMDTLLSYKRFVSHLEYLLSWQTHLHNFFTFRNIWGTFRVTIHQKYHAFSSHITFPINVSTGCCWSMLAQFLLTQCCSFLFLSFYGAYFTFAKNIFLFICLGFLSTRSALNTLLIIL